MISPHKYYITRRFYGKNHENNEQYEEKDLNANIYTNISQINTFNIYISFMRTTAFAEALIEFTLHYVHDM